MNALGQPRAGRTTCCWHHAAHTVDLFAYQCGQPHRTANAMQGPIHPALGIAMDMSIQLKAAANGAICTLSLSFNNDGPLGTFFRYIGDTRYLYRPLRRSGERQGKKRSTSEVDVSNERHQTAGPRILRPPSRRPRTQRQSVAQVLPCYQVLNKLERQLAL